MLLVARVFHVSNVKRTIWLKGCQNRNHLPCNRSGNRNVVAVLVTPKLDSTLNVENLIFVIPKLKFS